MNYSNNNLMSNLNPELDSDSKEFLQDKRRIDEESRRIGDRLMQLDRIKDKVNQDVFRQHTADITSKLSDLKHHLVMEGSKHSQSMFSQAVFPSQDNQLFFMEATNFINSAQGTDPDVDLAKLLNVTSIEEMTHEQHHILDFHFENKHEVFNKRINSILQNQMSETAEKLKSSKYGLTKSTTQNQEVDLDEEEKQIIRNIMF